MDLRQQRNVGEPSATHPPLAGPVPASVIFQQAEKQTQNFIYTAGFLLMFVGSVLSIVSIAIGRT